MCVCVCVWETSFGSGFPHEVCVCARARVCTRACKRACVRLSVRASAGFRWAQDVEFSKVHECLITSKRRHHVRLTVPLRVAPVPRQSAHTAFSTSWLSPRNGVGSSAV